MPNPSKTIVGGNKWFKGVSAADPLASPQTGLTVPVVSIIVCRIVVRIIVRIIMVPVITVRIFSIIPTVVPTAMIMVIFNHAAHAG
jgi:hypothetical protein